MGSIGEYIYGLKSITAINSVTFLILSTKPFYRYDN